MNEEFDEYLYINECFRIGNECSGYYISHEGEWFKNYQLLKLLIEFKKFFELNKIDYKVDIQKMYKKFIEKEITEEYEVITFADFCLNYILEDLGVGIKLCIDSVEDLRDMYDKYEVYLNTYSIGINFFSDVYALTYSPGGCSWDLLNGLEDTLVNLCNDWLGIKCREEDVYEHVVDLVRYLDAEVVDSLSVIGYVNVSSFVCFEPYKVLKLVNEMGLCIYETASIR